MATLWKGKGGSKRRSLRRRTREQATNVSPTPICQCPSEDGSSYQITSSQEVSVEIDHPLGAHLPTTEDDPLHVIEDLDLALGHLSVGSDLPVDRDQGQQGEGNDELQWTPDKWNWNCCDSAIMHFIMIVISCLHVYTYISVLSCGLGMTRVVYTMYIYTTRGERAQALYCRFGNVHSQQSFVNSTTCTT